MEPTKDDPNGRQHQDPAQEHDQVVHKQEPQKQPLAEDENHLLPPHINRAVSPSSTISSGYGPTLGMYPAHDEGLPEVVPDSSPQAMSRLEAEYKRKYLEGDAPQTVIPKDVDTNKIAVMGGEEQSSVTPDGMSGDVEGAHTGRRGGKRICGLPRRTLWILHTIVDFNKLNYIHKNKHNHILIHITNPVFPQQPNNLWQHATTIIDDEGGTDLGFEARSYVWLPSVTDCCITFCTNATSKGMVGWLCSQRKQPKSSDPFKRVYVWCHQKHEKANAICIDPKT
ncbi:hypothetical protein THARTR1_06009 [Trichoderma harzianum]|uniref:Uncharacterized protein n=1 Tax=Trichoderma harzianum TaxID=5544 RepID=A0A2K0U6A9_TRIHA|nr:hypothetical protein THARTR1_06009 [Trichoderma harzianum]